MNKLEYFIHDGADIFQLQFSGDLSGPAVGSLDQAWRFCCPGRADTAVPVTYTR